MKNTYLKKIIAQSVEDLKIISACCSESITKIRDIKYLPNSVALISTVSLPINRSEKWGIFVAKYNPDLQSLLFGYGPQQITEYYLSHKTKYNSGLVLPHSSLLDYLIFHY